MGGTKADRMDEIIATCNPAHTIALGDAPNDLEMLQKADFGVIVNNPAAPAIPPLPGEARGRIRRTQKQGPEGWAQAVMALLTELGKIGERKAHG
jgi:mannosyl-3-phosphoglycerate phosphatase